MTKLLRSLAAAGTALGVAAVAALADPPKPAPPADPKPAPDKSEIKPLGHVELKYAVDPKPLGDQIKKGLKWLAERQNPDGGWSQGGGWRTGDTGGGRVDGKDVADPSDVGNTCMTLLALVRAGNTPTQGEYKEHVKKGLRFVAERVEKADDKDLYVTDVRGTQLQSKIGPYVDTFLTALVLSEVKGKGGDDEKRLAKVLDKTLAKMAKGQKEDGTFAGNAGWAPVLSQGVANKAIGRARLLGAQVPDEVLARAGRQSEAAAKGNAMPAGAPAATGAPAADFSGRGARFAGGGAGGDAGVPLYSSSQAAGNSQDIVNTVKIDAEEAKKVIADPKATKDAKEKAEKRVKEADRLEKVAEEARGRVVAQTRDAAFVRGFGSNGGEEFLSFLNISEMLVVKGGKEWTDWDKQMTELAVKAQDGDGSWSGHHCITGKTFCTSAALLVLMADRTQFPEAVIKAAREKKDEPKKDEKKDEKK